MRDGTEISVATAGSGQGGTLTVAASASIEVSGTGIRDGELSPSTLLAESTGAGSAGDLLLETGQLTVADGAEIQRQ